LKKNLSGVVRPSKNGEKENRMQLMNKTKKRLSCQVVNASHIVAGVW
jgi:hypothetical protein